MEQKEQDLTLTVPVGDIPLWLLERRKLPKDWGKKLRAVQTKCESTLSAIAGAKDLADVKAYLDSHQGRMQLKEWEQTEKLLIASEAGKERNLFGQYSSPLIKDVRVVIGMLRKENLSLANIGKEVADRIQFEMYPPSVKPDPQ